MTEASLNEQEIRALEDSVSELEKNVDDLQEKVNELEEELSERNALLWQMSDAANDISKMVS